MHKKILSDFFNLTFQIKNDFFKKNPSDFYILINKSYMNPSCEQQQLLYGDEQQVPRRNNNNDVSLSSTRGLIRGKIALLPILVTLAPPGCTCSEKEQQEFAQGVATTLRAAASAVEEKLPEPHKVRVNDEVAEGILKCYHPTGDYKSFESLDISAERVGDEYRTREKFKVRWEGGFTQTAYSTIFTLEAIEDLKRKIGKIKSSVITDDFPMQVGCETNDWQLRDMSE